jgi:hypothetical protein
LSYLTPFGGKQGRGKWLKPWSTCLANVALSSNPNTTKQKLKKKKKKGRTKKKIRPAGTGGTRGHH